MAQGLAAPFGAINRSAPIASAAPAAMGTGSWLGAWAKRIGRVAPFALIAVPIIYGIRFIEVEIPLRNAQTMVAGKSDASRREIEACVASGDCVRGTPNGPVIDLALEPASAVPCSHEDCLVTFFESGEDERTVLYRVQPDGSIHSVIDNLDGARSGTHLLVLKPFLTGGQVVRWDAELRKNPG